MRKTIVTCDACGDQHDLESFRRPVLYSNGDRDLCEYCFTDEVHEHLIDRGLEAAAVVVFGVGVYVPAEADAMCVCGDPAEFYGEGSDCCDCCLEDRIADALHDSQRLACVVDYLADNLSDYEAV